MVGHTIESFLLPSKQARQTMEQVRMRFVSTLNDRDKNGCTSLCHATLQFDVDAVTFLLQQNGIEVNKTSTFLCTEGTRVVHQKKTPLMIVGNVSSTDTEKQKSARKTIRDLLVRAGGVLNLKK